MLHATANSLPTRSPQSHVLVCLQTPRLIARSFLFIECFSGCGQVVRGNSNLYQSGPPTFKQILGSFNTSCCASRQTIAPGDKCWIIPISQQGTFEPVRLMHKGKKLLCSGRSENTPQTWTLQSKRTAATLGAVVVSPTS